MMIIDYLNYRSVKLTANESSSLDFKLTDAVIQQLEFNIPTFVSESILGNWS